MSEQGMFDDSPKPAALAQVQLSPDQLLAALGDKHPVFELLSSQQTALSKAQQQVENMVRLVITHAETLNTSLKHSESVREKLATKFLDMVELTEKLADARAEREREDRLAEAQEKRSGQAIDEMMPLLRMVAKRFLGVELAPDELGNGLDDFFESVSDEQWMRLVAEGKLDLTDAQRVVMSGFLEAKAAAEQAKREAEAKKAADKAKEQAT